MENSANVPDYGGEVVVDEEYLFSDNFALQGSLYITTPSYEIRLGYGGDYAADREKGVIDKDKVSCYCKVLAPLRYEINLDVKGKAYFDLSSWTQPMYAEDVDEAQKAVDIAAKTLTIVDDFAERYYFKYSKNKE